MTTLQWIILIVTFSLGYYLTGVIKKRRRKPRFTKDTVAPVDSFGQFTDPRVKIMYNPFTERFMWVALNIATHVWEWQCEATNAQVNLWKEEPDHIQKYGFSYTDMAARYAVYNQYKGVHDGGYNDDTH